MGLDNSQHCPLPVTPNAEFRRGQQTKKQTVWLQAISSDLSTVCPITRIQCVVLPKWNDKYYILKRTCTMATLYRNSFFLLCILKIGVFAIALCRTNCSLYVSACCLYNIHCIQIGTENRQTTAAEKKNCKRAQQSS